MSETKWTAAQQAAIDDRGGALLVSAAAGSGKTAVLTERAVRLITDPECPIDADKLLIVTFTNAAAAELRARIGQALLRRSQAEPGNTALRRQRMLLQRAPICTIDAFCLDLLRKHFQALDIPPDFSPADPGSVASLRAAALAETLEQAYADPDFCAFADLYGKGRLRGLRRRIRRASGARFYGGNCGSEVSEIRLDLHGKGRLLQVLRGLRPQLCGDGFGGDLRGWKRPRTRLGCMDLQRQRHAHARLQARRQPHRDG